MTRITHADGSITWGAICACGDEARGKTLPGQPLPDHPQCPTCAFWWPIADEPCDPAEFWVTDDFDPITDGLEAA